MEGFRVKLVNDNNLFEWEVAIFGPPETLYQGGYFKVWIFLPQLELIRTFQARVTFPSDYPYSPPALKFLTKVWHPNVYEVCFFRCSVKKLVLFQSAIDLLTSIYRTVTCVFPFYIHR